MDIVAAADEIDDLGHVSNIAYVRWVQDVARAHSEALGFGVAAYRDLGVIFVVRRHEIEYLRPAYAGDRIVLRTWIDSWKAATSVRMTSIMRMAQQGEGEIEIELARARTLWALVSTDTGRPRRIPDAILQAFTTSHLAP